MPAVLVFALLLVLVVGAAPVFLEPGHGLARTVFASLSATRVENPVTAVLLDFRGYDTLLEVGVLLIAWLGGSATTARTSVNSMSTSTSPVATTLAGLLAAPAILLAAHLLWVGTDAPGGAFQAGAVAAAAIITVRLGAPVDAWTAPVLARVAPAGFAVFLVVAISAMGLTGIFLDYPRSLARESMMLIEVATAFSVAAILVALFDAVLAAGRGA
jgi:multisubunit Na+/H+ antiporter MnhB subunit